MNRSNTSALACVFIGDNSLLIHCADLARQRGHDVRCVITGTPAIVGWAQSEGIATVAAEGDYIRAVTELLVGQQLDVVFSVANLRRLPATLLHLAKRGGVNFHDGPLPRYGGVHAPAWALMSGERDYAITWHRMTERMDAGEIILQRAIAIEDDDTSLTLNLKCFEAGATSFGELLELLEEPKLPTRAHDLDRATYHRKSDRVPAAATLDWAQGSRDLVAIVRALDFGNYRNTLGAAKVAFARDLLIVRRARTVSETSSRSPGTVVRADANGIVVSTSSGDVLLDSFATLDGDPVSPSDAATRGGVVSGQALPHVDAEQRAKLSAVDRESAPNEEFWVQRLLQTPLDLPVILSAADGATQPRAGRSWQWLEAIPLPQSNFPERPQLTALAAVCAWLGHVGSRSSYDIALTVARPDRRTQGIERWIMDAVPLHVELEGFGMSAFIERLAETIARLTKAGIPLRDLIARTPELRNHRRSSPIVVILADSTDAVVAPLGSQLAFAIDSRGLIRIGLDEGVIDARVLRSFDSQLSALFASAQRDVPVSRLSVLDEAARDR